MPSRRAFLSAVAAGAAAPAVAQAPARPWVGLQVYPWKTFRQRSGLPGPDADLPGVVAEAAKTGADGFEGVASDPKEVQALAAACKANGLAMRSLYIPAVLHDPLQARPQFRKVLATAAEAKKHGVTVIVCNPAPISWVPPLVDKTDQALQTQAQHLGMLGRSLKGTGLTLAYHTHDMEMRQGAREFHHMLLHTDPAELAFCLDAHWLFRGAGDSELAVFDAVKLYGKRIVELHLRQSHKGVWTEAFGRGDLDYPRLAVELADLGLKPLVVLEQAVEAKTPNTLDAVTAHTRGVGYAREVFGAVAG
jgi:inosose dehydratase